jgi:FtsZ-binding cell division protein ZapB
MKNNFLISPNYLLQLENDELRERIKRLISEVKELKKIYEEREREREREGMVQDKGSDAIIQE